MGQLQLDLAPRRARARELPVIDRLKAIVRRHGLEPDWKGPPMKWNCHIMPLPCLGVPNDRRSLAPREPESGSPPQGSYETMCGWCTNFSDHPPEDRWAYMGRDEAC